MSLSSTDHKGFSRRSFLNGLAVGAFGGLVGGNVALTLDSTGMTGSASLADPLGLGAVQVSGNISPSGQFYWMMGDALPLTFAGSSTTAMVSLTLVGTGSGVSLTAMIMAGVDTYISGEGNVMGSVDVTLALTASGGVLQASGSGSVSLTLDGVGTTSVGYTAQQNGLLLALPSPYTSEVLAWS